MAVSPETPVMGLSPERRPRNGWRQRLHALRLVLARKRFFWKRGLAARFVLVPPCLQVSDPSIAVDFAHGQIVLAGRSLLARGVNPFTAPAPSTAFVEALHSFEWLRHFSASDHPEIRAAAHRLLRQWLDDRDAARLPQALLDRTVARRILAVITACPLLAEAEDTHLYSRVLVSLAQDLAIARVLARPEGPGALRLQAAIAARIYAMALEAPARLERDSVALFEAAHAEGLDSQGVPRDRSPQSALELASALIALQALYRARNLQIPALINRSIQSLVGFLRLLQLPDGGLAHFEGGNRVDRDHLAEVIGFGNRQQPRPEALQDAGFERIEDAHAVLIVDAGTCPPPGFATHAHAGALGFEFATRGDRMIVSCGLPPGGEGEIMTAYRSAGAHSTVLVENDGANGLLPEDEGGALTTAGTAFVPHRAQGANGTALTIGHDGWRARHGYLCERRLTLLANGEGLQGLDRIVDAEGGATPIRITLAFHLHPRLLPVRLTRADAVVLRLPHQKPGQDVWLFHAPGHAITLEESRCFDGDAVQSSTKALVLDIAASGTTDILWSLTPYRAP